MHYVIDYNPGDKVFIKDAMVNAVVNRVIIDRSTIQYECQWWDCSECRTMEFYGNELSEITGTNKSTAEKINMNAKN